MDTNRFETYRKAGYTWYVEWYGFDALLGFDVRKGFPTTDDVVNSHVRSLQSKGYSVIKTSLRQPRTLGFADAVKKHGDGWRVALECAYYQANDRDAGRAVLLSNGLVPQGYSEYLLMRGLTSGWERGYHPNPAIRRRM